MNVDQLAFLIGDSEYPIDKIMGGIVPFHVLYPRVDVHLKVIRVLLSEFPDFF